jgi:hypothetical protein
MEINQKRGGEIIAFAWYKLKPSIHLKQSVKILECKKNNIKFFFTDQTHYLSITPLSYNTKFLTK